MSVSANLTAVQLGLKPLAVSFHLTGGTHEVSTVLGFFFKKTDYILSRMELLNLYLHCSCHLPGMTIQGVCDDLYLRAAFCLIHYLIVEGYLWFTILICLSS